MNSDSMSTQMDILDKNYEAGRITEKERDRLIDELISECNKKTDHSYRR